MATKTLTPEMINLVAKIAEDYRAALPSATGKLKSFTYSIEYEGNMFTVYFDLPSYWQYVENGRKAGKMPPISAIKNWISAKHIPAYKNIDSAAFLIARSIGKKGIPAKHTLANTLAKDQYLIDKISDLLIEQLTDEIS